jgi:hypothetical protein
MYRKNVNLYFKKGILSRKFSKRCKIYKTQNDKFRKRITSPQKSNLESQAKNITSPTKKI